METLRIGVIGVGHFGAHYVRLLKVMPGAALRATANNDREARALLRRDDIDGVVIATPPATHARLAAAALDAGKHVLVEKPLVLSLADAKRLQTTATRSGQILMVGHQYLFNDYVIALRDLLQREKLGTVRSIIAEHLSCGPLRRDVGVFWDAAPHVLSMIDFFFPGVNVLDAQGVNLAMLGDGQDDVSTCTATFSGGLTLTLVASRFSPQKVRRLWIAGTKGMALFDDQQLKGKLRVTRYPYPQATRLARHRSYFFTVPPSAVTTPAISTREPLRNELEHFIACVRTGKAPLTDIEHGLRVTRWLEYIRKRMKTLNPKH